ncbi:flagellin [Candidatus Magnetaquicoccus inordinatus]|uniref:flagellin N-terminal helical domain-containing protein n=1 Tax=Candidatus Magnetaquicoccus inordinatus TaxID=2496818 RepID=UPI00102C963F|nr:flagellin [Candidatus Magnetaquicoccus inordinatus]
MALVLNTNINSMNAQRNIGIVNDSLTRTFQRLASGMRINTAMDDAAGLAISTRMTAQIKGLSQAVRNANDGISMAQVAEGALNESVNALQRIRELAVQAANGTMTSSDRKDLQLEVCQLLSEINRIAVDTQFNGFSMLTGNFLTEPKMVIQVGAKEGQAISFSIMDMRLSALGKYSAMSGSAQKLSTDGSTLLYSYRLAKTSYLSGGVTALSTDGVTAKLAYPNLIGTRSAAESTIGLIDTVLDRVSRERAHLGALQNRFTAVIANLNNVVENMSAARSRILDADIATETANLTQKTILQQAGTAVLAQANQLPKLALQLLQ